MIGGCHGLPRSMKRKTMRTGECLALRRLDFGSRSHGAGAQRTVSGWV